MSIQELAAKLNGAQRSNRYRINFTLPAGVGGDIKTLQILARATSLPGKDRGQIEIKKLGKTARLRGDDVTTATWNCEFLLSKNPAEVIKTMEAWYALQEDYKTTMTVDLLDVTNEVSMSFKLDGVFVLNLPPIAVSTEDADAVLPYDCTFSVDEIKPV